MIKSFIQKANEGQPVYITEVTKAFEALEDRREVYCVLDLINPGERKAFSLFLPSELDETLFIRNYFYGKIYNVLSTLGGVKLTLYVDESQKDLTSLVNGCKEVFGLGVSRKERQGYAKVINVTDRMIENLVGEVFTIVVKDMTEKPRFITTNGSEPVSPNYKKVVDGLEGVFCGIDIGGTDIKIAVSVDQRIAFFKEYDWCPANLSQMDDLITPIIALVELTQAKLTYDKVGGDFNHKDLLEAAMEKDADTETILDCVAKCKDYYGDEMMLYDGIGMCFPDVVVKNKIVGGEVLKTRGIRNNNALDYEAEFKKLSHLDLLLKEHCKQEGIVHITNDGPMASYTAAVEMSYAEGNSAVLSGVFAHTLGTELGTGWVDERGQIPEIPLEAYNYVIDLGSYDQIGYEPDDLRSILNFNTGIAGTVQKYASQSGVFRLAIKYFKETREDLYEELVDLGFVVEEGGALYVPTEGIDMRKAFLEHVMSLPEREEADVCHRIFREIGEHLAVTYLETEEILKPITKERVLFGRLVKNKRCFELMQEGAASITNELNLIIADDGIANTPLMKQLKEHEAYTIAQFAQAVGAIYFAMSAKV